MMAARDPCNNVIFFTPKIQRICNHPSTAVHVTRCCRWWTKTGHFLWQHLLVDYEAGRSSCWPPPTMTLRGGHGRAQEIAQNSDGKQDSCSWKRKISRSTDPSLQDAPNVLTLHWFLNIVYVDKTRKGSWISWSLLTTGNYISREQNWICSRLLWRRRSNSRHCLYLSFK